MCEGAKCVLWERSGTWAVLSSGILELCNLHLGKSIPTFYQTVNEGKGWGRFGWQAIRDQGVNIRSATDTFFEFSRIYRKLKQDETFCKGYAPNINNHYISLDIRKPFLSCLILSLQIDLLCLQISPFVFLVVLTFC